MSGSGAVPGRSARVAGRTSGSGSAIASEGIGGRSSGSSVWIAALDPGRLASAQLRLDPLALQQRVRRLPKRRVDPAARSPLLRPVVENDNGDQRDAGGEKAEEQRVHIHAGRAYCGTVSASSSASAISTATTRETPGSAIVMPIS